MWLRMRVAKFFEYIFNFRCPQKTWDLCTTWLIYSLSTRTLFHGTVNNVNCLKKQCDNEWLWIIAICAVRCAGGGAIVYRETSLNIVPITYVARAPEKWSLEVNVFGTRVRRPLSPRVKNFVQGTSIVGDECAWGHFWRLSHECTTWNCERWHNSDQNTQCPTTGRSEGIWTGDQLDTCSKLRSGDP